MLLVAWLLGLRITPLVTTFLFSFWYKQKTKARAALPSGGTRRVGGGAIVPWCHGGHPGKFLSGAGDALSNPPYVFLRVYTLTFKTLYTSFLWQAGEATHQHQAQ